MPGFLRVPVYFILLGVCLLAGKANASALETAPGTDIEGVFCGIGHKKTETPAKPAQTGEVESSIPTGPVLAQSGAGGRMKCHITAQLTGNADDHPCHQIKCCDPTLPGGGSALVFLQLYFAPAVVDTLEQAQTSMPRGASVTFPLSRPEAPELRPPVSITV